MNRYAHDSRSADWCIRKSDHRPRHRPHSACPGHLRRRRTRRRYSPSTRFPCYARSWDTPRNRLPICWNRVRSATGCASADPDENEVTMPIHKPWIQPSIASQFAPSRRSSVSTKSPTLRATCSTSVRPVVANRSGCAPGSLCTSAATTRNAVLRERAAQFRWEANQQYTTKRLEMLMQFQRDEGREWPPAHEAGDWRDTPQLGRLRRSQPIEQSGG